MPDELAPVWWCDDCKAYGCGWCDDFHADNPADVEAHAVDCPDRPRKAEVLGLAGP